MFGPGTKNSTPDSDEQDERTRSAAGRDNAAPPARIDRAASAARLPFQRRRKEHGRTRGIPQRPQRPLFVERLGQLADDGVAPLGKAGRCACGGARCRRGCATADSRGAATGGCDRRRARRSARRRRAARSRARTARGRAGSGERSTALPAHALRRPRLRGVTSSAGRPAPRRRRSRPRSR